MQSVETDRSFLCLTTYHPSKQFGRYISITKWIYIGIYMLRSRTKCTKKAYTYLPKWRRDPNLYTLKFFLRGSLSFDVKRISHYWKKNFFNSFWFHFFDEKRVLSYQKKIFFKVLFTRFFFTRYWQPRKKNLSELEKNHWFK